MDLLGAFLAGFLFALFCVGSAVNSNDSKIEDLKKENNKLKSLKGLHIGQVVYAKDKNSLYIGNITGMNYHYWKENTIELNGDETFKLSDIYLTKDEVLKQLEI
ncbi:MAG: hypothetical protein Q4A00_05710 [Flavobacteriaceae bacterium]|nr:hypothetical protein [Flavobacteriaceae bacterium]